MKRIILSVTMLLLVATSFAQNTRYESVMIESKAMLDSAKTDEDYTAAAASFERIAEAEKKQWHPYYYAALANILRGFSQKEANKDELATAADALIAKAEAIDPRNSEIFLLKGMAATLHMIVDPMNRWQKYGGMQREAIETAKQFNNQNPRIYYWEAQNLMGTPEQFGGGKAKARPLFEKSLELFATDKPATKLDPTWGEAVAKKMLELCKQ